MSFGRASGWLFTAIVTFSVVSPYVADYNETHVFNPRWPAHAKFHIAQVRIYVVLLNAAALYYTWRRAGRTADNLVAATPFTAAYWVSLAASITFPGTAWLDPEFDLPREYVLGIPGNAFCCLVVLPLVGLAALLGYTHLRRRTNPHGGTHGEHHAGVTVAGRPSAGVGSACDDHVHRQA